MSETKFTPGPWECREVAHEATPYAKRRVYRMEIIAPQYLYGKRTHSRDICQILDYCEWTDHPGNAALICAAPDLLAALEDCVNGLGCQPGYVNGLALQRAILAIAKAKGEA